MNTIDHLKYINDKYKLHKVYLELDDEKVLSNKQFKSLCSNRKYWWIKRNNSSTIPNYAIDYDNVEFLDMEKIEGNKKFKMEIELPCGYYTIGCGSSKNGIRYDFFITKEGELK